MNTKKTSRLWIKLGLLLALTGTSAVWVATLPSEAVAQTTKAAEPPKAGAAPHQSESFLWWIIKTSGIIGAVIFLLSIYFVAVTVQQFLDLREKVAMPPELLAECDRLLEARNVQEMYNILRADDSYFGRTLSVGIAELQHGVNEAREVMERQADACTVEMEKKISILATLGTLGPMIGLLGTLKGMIASFSEIAISGVKMDAGKVAGGISEALVLTFEGVALSVPAIYFYALFRNRISAISVKAMLMADEYLRRIARLARTKPGGTA
jgi:biopolymer transport protein ExbB